MSDLLRPVHDRADALEPVYTADEVASWPPGALDRLSALGLVRRACNAGAVVCDACGGDHVEEVFYVESPPGTELRAYIRCPEEGRVFVPLERLKRWEVSFRRLAEVTASALATVGDIEDVTPSRVWLLGKTTLAGRPHDMFLARGLPWPDGAEVVGRASRLLASAHPIVLVPGSVPPAAVWPCQIPPVLPLSALMSWDGNRLIIDRAYLEGAITKGGRANLPARTKSKDPANQGPEALGTRPADERAVKERMALAELLLIGPNASKIAEKIGVPRTTLLGWSTFRDFYDNAKKDEEVARRSRRRARRAGERDFEIEEDE